MFKLLAVTLILVAFCIAGLGIRILLKKNGEFSHRCAVREAGGELGSCHSCSATGRHEDCPNYQLHHGNTASQLAQAVDMADEK
ncbi:MAG: hypothetical protein NC048_04865 [Bacteroides sp.]|nr:hypothetical protein [Ruminococcus flavefaciens]MCM1554808.1 hypothetical protein [Bacteroides sp.]